MNGNTMTAQADRRASVCDEAYDQLQNELAAHEGLLDELIARTSSALRDPLPRTDDKVGGPTPVDNPAQSELHGRLLGSAKRVRQQNTALREILDRLTL